MNIASMYYKEVRQCYRTFTQDEERALAKRAKKGDLDARNQLLCSLLPMVAQLARRRGGRSVEFMDLVQAGNQGAMHAIRKFNPARARLTTYAHRWIRQYMQREIERRDSLIYVPKHVFNPNNEMGFTPEQLDRIREMQNKVMSLGCNGHFDDNQGGVACDQHAEPIEDAIESERRENEMKLIDRLSPVQRTVVLGRLKGRILSDIGKEIGVCKERVRQICEEAIEELQKMTPITNRKKVCS